MRTIRGYVCIGYIDRNRVLFGKPQNGAGRAYESLETNGITPFDTVEDATPAMAELRKRHFRRVSLHSLRMDIAETERDLMTLADERSLIVIMYGEGQLTFWGRPTPNQPATLYASLLAMNDVLPFSGFAAAERCAREVRRQGLSRAAIAAFHTHRVTRTRHKKRARATRLR